MSVCVNEIEARETIAVPGPVNLPPITRELTPVYPDSPFLDNREHQLVSVSVVTGGSRTGEVLVVPTAFTDGPHTPMQSIRSRVIAAATGLDVVTVGVPGMAASHLELPSQYDHGQYSLTSGQLRELHQGDPTLLGATLWEAVKEAAGRHGIDPNERTIHFLNYSQGVFVAAGMLAAATAFAERPGRIVNAEGPAYKQTTVWERLRSFTHSDEQRANKAYEANNPDWVPRTTDGRSLLSLGSNLVRHPHVHWRMAQALARGASTDHLLDALRALDVPSKAINIVYANGSKSRVSATAANDAAAEQVFKETGAKKSINRLVWKGERHGFCNDLGRFAFQVGQLLK